MTKKKILSIILAFCFMISLMPVLPSSAASSRVESLLSGMTLRDKVTRILTVKENRGILDFDNYSYTVNQAKQTVGSSINRQKERELSAAAVTVVKNKNNVLPIKLTSSSKVLMLCPYDNERAQLVMGWNRALDAGLVPAGAEMKYIRFSSASLTGTIQSAIVCINSTTATTATPPRSSIPVATDSPMMQTFIWLTTAAMLLFMPPMALPFIF